MAVCIFSIRKNCETLCKKAISEDFLEHKHESGAEVCKQGMLQVIYSSIHKSNLVHLIPFLCFLVLATTPSQSLRHLWISASPTLESLLYVYSIGGITSLGVCREMWRLPFLISWGRHGKWSSQCVQMMFLAPAPSQMTSHISCLS